MAGTLLLMATLGLSWLIDARQQSALLLPLYALCWLVAAMAAGWDAAVPIGVGVASSIVQTHFTYVYPALVLSAFGVAAYVVVTRRRSPRRWARTAAWGVGVAVLCWIQPLIDQLWGRGNLGAVLGPARRSQDAAGLRAGVEVLAGGVLTPPWWLPGSFAHLPAALRRRLARRRRRSRSSRGSASPSAWPRGPATPAIGPWWRWRPPPRPPSSPRWWGPP